MHGVNTVEFARKAGVSKARISAAIKAGVLSKSVTRVPGAGRGGNDAITIDLEAGLQEWSTNRDMNRVSIDSSVKRQSAAALDADSEMVRQQKADKARREKFNALVAELDYKERAGKLVSTAEVEKQAFQQARNVRDAILNIPARVAALLATMNDTHAIEEMLIEHLTQALEDLAHAR